MEDKEITSSHATKSDFPNILTGVDAVDKFCENYVPTYLKKSFLREENNSLIFNSINKKLGLVQI